MSSTIHVHNTYLYIFIRRNIRNVFMLSCFLIELQGWGIAKKAWCVGLLVGKPRACSHIYNVWVFSRSDSIGAAAAPEPSLGTGKKKLGTCQLTEPRVTPQMVDDSGGGIEIHPILALNVKSIWFFEIFKLKSTQKYHEIMYDELNHEEQLTRGWNIP